MLKITIHEPLFMSEASLLRFFDLVGTPVLLQVQPLLAAPEEASVDTAVEETPKKRRGRPPRSEAAVEAAVDTAEAPVEAAEAPVETSAEEAPKKRRGRPPRSEASVEAAEAESAEAPKKRRGRPPKAESTEEAEEAEEAEAEAEEAEAEEALERTISRTEIAKRFSVLVENDYDSALELIEAFGVSGFSKLPDSSLAAFNEALSEAEDKL